MVRPASSALRVRCRRRKCRCTARITVWASSPPAMLRSHSLTAAAVRPEAAAITIRSSASSAASPTAASTSLSSMLPLPSAYRASFSTSARDRPRSAPRRATSSVLASGVICSLAPASTSRIMPSRSRASSGKQATAAACGAFSNSARRASSGRRLPASTIRKPCSTPLSTSGFSDAAVMRRPAVARTILRPPNIGAVCSSTAMRPGSSSRLASSRRRISPGGFSRSARRLASAKARSATRPASVPYRSTADGVVAVWRSKPFRKASA